MDCTCPACKPKRLHAAAYRPLKPGVGQHLEMPSQTPLVALSVDLSRGDIDATSERSLHP